MGSLEFWVLGCSVLFVSWIDHCTGLRLPECSDNRLTVDETAPSVDITCDQISNQEAVAWSLQKSGSDSIPLGSCPPQGSCSQASLYSLTRSSSTSTVTITPSNSLRTIGSYDITCNMKNDASQTAICPLDVVYPSQASCSVSANSGTWKVNGTCSITKTFSSRNTYKCEVFRGTSQDSQTTGVMQSRYTPTSHSDPAYRRGSCSFTSDLPIPNSNRQDYYYRTEIYPGPRTIIRGPVTIEKPTAPTISCPAIVGENSSLTCTCSTANIGQPAGWLHWSRVSGGSIVQGEYGVVTLDLPQQTLTRDDNGRPLFQCEVDWAAGTYRDVYTANVGFPPTQTEMRVNSDSPYQSVTVSENDDVSFACTITGGNPAATLTLSDPGTVLQTGSSPLTHKVSRSQCEASGAYTCKANNGFGQDVTARVMLYVNCKPRGDNETGYVNFNNKSESFDFDVTAFPVPHEVSFNFLGSLANGRATAVTGITLDGRCEAKPGVVYLSTCTVTVSSVTTADAAGFYRVTVTNTQGSGNFRFQVDYKVQEADTTDNSIDCDDTLSYREMAVGVTVVLGLLIVTLVIVVIWLWRRQWTLPCADSTHSHCSDCEQKRSTEQNLQTQVPSQTEAYAGPYESLQMSDIGLRSVYTEIGPNGNNDVNSRSREAGGLYENTRR